MKQNIKKKNELKGMIKAEQKTSFHFKKFWMYYLPTMNNIPSKLINEWAKIVEDILDEITTLSPKKSESSWKKLFMVSKCIWFRSQSRQREKKKEKHGYTQKKDRKME